MSRLVETKREPQDVLEGLRFPIQTWYFPRGAGGSSLVGGLGFLIGITAPDQYELWNYTNMAGKEGSLKPLNLLCS